MQLTARDEQVRGALTRLIASSGFAPSHAMLAATVGVPVADVEESLDRLHATHSLLLHPHERRVWVAHPFALSPGSCWVQTAERGYWANCLYCALGIAAAIAADATITTRLGGEGETVQIAVRDGSLVSGHDLCFHLSTPVARWWDNVIAACASFQPFRDARDVDDWCNRHVMPHGHVMSLPALWLFAQDWYGSYLSESWHKRSPAEIERIFARHGLMSDFWRIGIETG